MGRKSKTCSLPWVHTDKLYLEAFGKTENDSQYLDTLSDSHSFQRAHMIDPRLRGLSLLGLSVWIAASIDEKCHQKVVRHKPLVKVSSRPC